MTVRKPAKSNQNLTTNTKKRKAESTSANRGGDAGTSTTEEDELSGIVYIGHIPHGFYEKEMKGFFGQFGDIKNVRLSRSKKTAKSKGYAFVEFKSPDVAPIVASAMNGYMMYTQKIQVHVMKKIDVHPELFKGANTQFKEKQWRGMEAEKHNKVRTAEESAARLARAVRRDKARQKAITASGIEYSYDSLEAALPKKSKRTVFAEET